MKKFALVVLLLAILAAIGTAGWFFFQMNMAVHPLVRDCYLALEKRMPELEAPSLLGARFMIDEKEGATLRLACEVGSGKERKHREFLFPLTLASGEAIPPAGKNPFEEPAFAFHTVLPAGAAEPLALAEPIHGRPTPSFVHRPLAVTGSVRDGRVYGPASMTTYNRVNHFFRYDDEKAK